MCRKISAVPHSAVDSSMVIQLIFKSCNGGIRPFKRLDIFTYDLSGTTKNTSVILNKNYNEDKHATTTKKNDGKKMIELFQT